MCKVLIVLLLGVCIPSMSSAGEAAIRNGGFDEAGGSLAGWNSPEALITAVSENFEMTADPNAAHSGAAGARISSKPSFSPQQIAGANNDYGRIRQSVDVAAFRGRRTRLTGWLKTLDVKNGGAGLFFRVDGENPQMPIAFDNMGTWAVSGTTRWQKCEITLDVPPEAKRILVGASLFGSGTVYVDDLALSVVEPAADSQRDNAPLDARGLDNLIAFTRLFGYVRFFHPSDQAANASDADWERLAISGVEAVEKSESPAALAAMLQQHFAQVAPTVRVVVSGQKTELDPSLSGGAGDATPIAWRHLGCGLVAKRSGAYASERVPAASGLLTQVISGSKHPNPPRVDQPWTVELPGGVTVSVPLAVYRGENGTLPTATPTAETPSDPTHDEEADVYRLRTANERSVRLAAVVCAWNVFQHFYPYFDVIDADWNATLERSLKSAATDPDPIAFKKTLERLVADLDDGHGNVSAGMQDFREVLPIAVDLVGDDLVVTARHDSLSADVDVRPGDVIEEINGEPTRARIAEATTRISAATKGWLKHRLRTEMTAGPRGGKCTLTLRRDGKTHAVTLKYQNAFTIEMRPDRVAEIRPGIWYLDLGRISDDDFKKALSDLKSARGLICDMRGYPGKLSPIVLSHLIDQKIDCARWNIPIVTRPDRTELDWQFSNWPVHPLEPRLTSNVAFIIYGGAISYAETYIGMVEAYKLGELVGETTAGTNGNVNPFTTPGGYTISWTGMKVLKHDKSQHHGVGIKPTVPVERTREGIAAGRDEFLEKAIEVVSSRLAANK